jgi:DNA polymerase-3 subunit gamma/tau
MTYTVFARRYRPQSFREVVGQEAIAETLRNAIQSDRVAHAYLFAGPRGVGKTSMARILAKALNCARLEDGEPCNRCDACVTITEGSNFDVDEFDAASNRKVEDAERLIERVRQPRPARADSKARVFIVDEVHMMTTTAFNALLKTLEEPPAHVKFVFATTEPEKLPETILSRCQRFDFKRITRNDTIEHLRTICEREGIEADEQALRLIARRARGGMRDAQSLLDQAITLSASTTDTPAPAASDSDASQAVRLSADRLEAALGMAPREQVLHLLGAVASGAVEDVLLTLDRIYQSGLDAGELCAQIAQTARDCMVLSTLRDTGDAVALLEDPGSYEELSPLARALGRDRALHILATVVELERRIQTARDDRVLIELAFVKLARLPDMVGLSEAIQRLEALEERLTAAGADAPVATTAASTRTATATLHPTTPKTQQPAPQRPAPQPAAPPEPQAPRPGSAARKTPSDKAPSEPIGAECATAAHARVVERLSQESPGLASLLKTARLAAKPTGAVVLTFQNQFDHDRVFGNTERAATVTRLYQDALGCTIALHGEVSQHTAAGKAHRLTTKDVLEDPDVQTVMNHLRDGALAGFEPPRHNETEQRT